MQTHAIVELEEGTLTATVGVREGGTARITASARLPLLEPTREALADALRSLASGALQGVAGAHVVLGDRRMQHFVSTVPRMAPAEVADFVVREALRVTGMPSAQEALAAVRLLRRLPGGRLAVGVTAIARNVWGPLREAFEQVHLEVLGLYSSESCLALAAADAGERAAVLECNGGRARFVLCDGAAPVQVRRFLLGGADGNADAFAAQLAMELPRTLDWLKETGHEPPTLLLLGTRVGLDENSIEMIRGDLRRIERAPVAVRAAEGRAPPGLAAAMLFAHLFAGTKPPSLLDRPTIRLPWSAGRILAIAAAAAAGLACTYQAVVDGRSLLEARARLATAAAETQRLELEMAQAGARPSPETASPEQARLQGALELRRPVSRLLAEVSACAGAALHLDELKFASTERIVVTGAVAGGSRQEALASLAAFSKRLRELPYLCAEGQEEVTEVAGQQNRFRFRIGLSWRNS